MKFGMFYIAEYLSCYVFSALLVTLFFGGYALPFLHSDGASRWPSATRSSYEYRMNHGAVVLIGALAFFAKTVLMSWVQIFFRWTLLRFRYDQVMRLGWTKLLPLALLNIMVTGFVVLALDGAGPATQSALKVLGDLTQAAVALGALAGFVAMVVGLLQPCRRRVELSSRSTTGAHGRCARRHAGDAATGVEGS